MKKIISLMIICLILACDKKEKQNPSIMIFDDSLEKIINSSAKIEYLVDSLNVAEDHYGMLNQIHCSLLTLHRKHHLQVE